VRQYGRLSYSERQLGFLFRVASHIAAV